MTYLAALCLLCFESMMWYSTDLSGVLDEVDVMKAMDGLCGMVPTACAVFDT